MYTPINIKRNEKYGSNYWEVFSPKVDRIVHFFSDLEYEHYILIETNPDIISFCEQPMRICSIIDEKKVESIIDMWVKYKNGMECFVKTKYLSELNPENPKHKRANRQTKAQQLWCNENGFNYEIKTDADIRGNPILLANMKTIFSYVKRNTLPFEVDGLYIIKYISTNKLSIDQISTFLPEMPLERIKESVAWMLYKGKVIANVGDIEFGVNTEVWMNAE